MSGILVCYLVAIQLQVLHTITRLIVHLDKSVMVCNNIFHLFVFKEWNEYITLFRCIIKLVD